MVPKGNGDCWIVDKRMALAIITWLALQFFSTVWWAATTHAQVQENTKKIEKMESCIANLPAMQQDIKWLRSFLEKQSHQ